jgi:hypothetical protein
MCDFTQAITFKFRKASFDDAFCGTSRARMQVKQLPPQFYHSLGAISSRWRQA